MKIVDRLPGVGVMGPLTGSCPNGAAHNSPGQRPGNQATHISAFQRNAADGRITHPRRNPRPNDAALLQSASITTVRVPDAYPPSNPQGCTLGWYAALLQSACMPTVRVPDACPRPYPQGCTLGWYALPLWGKWNEALSEGCTLG